MVHILTLGLAVSRPHPLGHLTAPVASPRLPAEVQLLSKLGLGPGLETDWLEGWLQERARWSGEEWEECVGWGLGCPRTQAQVHTALRTSLNIHVQLNTSLNKRKPQSAVREPLEKAGSGWVALVTSPVPLPPKSPAETRASL